MLRYCYLSYIFKVVSMVDSVAAIFFVVWLELLQGSVDFWKWKIIMKKYLLHWKVIVECFHLAFFISLLVFLFWILFSGGRWWSNGGLQALLFLAMCKIYGIVRTVSYKGIGNSIVFRQLFLANISVRITFFKCNPYQFLARSISVLQVSLVNSCHQNNL